MTMIHAQLRRLHSPDVFDLKRYTPDDTESFCILVQAMVGPDKGPGEESFDFLVCTPQWLSSNMRIEEAAFTFGRHYVFLLRYDYQALLQAIQTLCDGAKGENWEAVAAFLSRFGRWEYEDYVP